MSFIRKRSLNLKVPATTPPPFIYALQPPVVGVWCEGIGFFAGLWALRCIVAFDQPTRADSDFSANRTRAPEATSEFSHTLYHLINAETHISRQYSNW